MNAKTALRRSRPRQAVRSSEVDERAERELAALLGTDYSTIRPREHAITVRPARVFVNAVVALAVVATSALAITLLGPLHQGAANDAPASTARRPINASSADVARALKAFRDYAAFSSTGGRFTISYVVTTAGEAETRFYGGASTSSNYDLPDMPALALVATGDFQWQGSHAPDVEPPRGRFLTGIVTLAEGSFAARGVQQAAPHLADLGVPVIDALN